MEANRIILGDCLEAMRGMPDKCVDLVVTSPPYENIRVYAELGFKLSGQAWVDWMVERIREMARVCRGLVCVVCEGQTRNYRYSATPILLMADLHRAGFNLRKPPIFQRSGIPGSGGPDWLRNDYEFCVCVTPAGRLPYSDNTACGKECGYPVGGSPSHRTKSGERVNQLSDRGMRRASGAKRKHGYTAPALANPGNVIKRSVGGGRMGSKLCHENEAPFPESLAEFFVRSFCPPDGIVLDPFSGSGTTAAVAQKNGRRWLGIDIRESQIELGNRRIGEISDTVAQEVA